MSFTSQLGTSDSQLGNIALGEPGSPQIWPTTDNVIISESVIRTVTEVRITTDNPVISENAEAVSLTGDVAFDHVTLSETVIRISNQSRQTTDAPTLSEIAIASKQYVATIADSARTAETVIISYSAGKTTTDTPKIHEDITTQKLLQRSISQSLTITQSHLVATPTQSVEQNLLLNQTVIKTGNSARSFSNSLIIIQSADYFQFLPSSFSQSLTVTQAVSEVKTTGFVNTLTITQDADYQYDPHLDQRNQLVTITQNAIYLAIFTRTIQQPLVLIQTASPSKIITRTVSSILGIGQSVLGGPVRKASNTLTLTHSVNVAVFRNKSIQNILQITHSVNLQMTLTRSLTSTLVFLKEHQIPNGSGGFINVPNLILTRGGSALTNCICPVSSATTVFQSQSRAIILPNPEFNDSENLVGAVNIKRTITGGTFSYVKKSSNRKLKYKFLINQRKASELRKFLLDFLGDRITMTNFKGEMWSGYLLSDPAEITSNMRGGECTGDLFEIDLEYQGVRIN